MAREVYAFQVTIPAGTAKILPYRQKTTLPVRKVDTLEIVIPPGPSGLMGFAITMSTVAVLPIVAGTYVVTDDEHISWPLSDLPTSGDWQVSGYNTDTYDHTIYLRWLVDLAPAPTTTSILDGIDIGSLSSS